MLSTNPLDPYSIAKSFNFIVAVNSKIHRPPCLTELAATAHCDTLGLLSSVILSACPELKRPS